MKRLLVALLLAIASSASFALPTLDEVQAEVGKGNYSHAEEMMREVVAAKPGSARAHYVYAEILAHDRRFELAAEEAARARKLDPSIKFTQPEKFSAFEALIERERSAAKHARSPERATPAMTAPAMRESVRPQPDSGIPSWAWGLGGAALALVAWRLISARRQVASPGYGGSPVAMAGGQPGGPAPAGFGANYTPSYPPTGAPQSAGSGMLGTGMAVAGGLAAGMLVSKLMSDHHDRGGQNAADGASSSGLTPGAFDDDGAARDLEERPIDFGSGDGWDSAGSSDSGGGGGGSGSDDGW